MSSTLSSSTLTLLSTSSSSSPPPLNGEEWRRRFSSMIADVGDGMSYSQAADRLREIIRSGLLLLTDIVENPDRFFEAHRLLAAHATRLGPGFFIRFTVHYNLFAGTVMALGTPEQIQALVQRNQIKPRLGCFGLTECLAGVNSGLVVHTTATFEKGSFVLHTREPATASKNWISQGLVADEAVVIATLTVNSQNLGPQAFLISMRDEATGQLRDGIKAVDMGRKTVGNDLDNARLTFHQVRVPLSTLLCRYVSVDEQGNVSQRADENGKKKSSMEFIGQRLFTGRVAVAQAALTFASSLFDKTLDFAKHKKCWAPGGRSPSLFDVPQLTAIFAESQRELARLHEYMKQVEKQLCYCLRHDIVPSIELQRAIAVGKVKAIEGAISLCFALKQEVGSYALMAGTGFEQMDFLQCCKFAEGDSRILMQKMARDLYRQFSASAASPASSSLHPLEISAVRVLQGALKKANADKKMNDAAAWDACWREVYALSEAHMAVVLTSFGCAPKHETLFLSRL